MAARSLARAISASFLFVLLATPIPGHAEFEYDLRASGSVGASDNPRSLPDETNAGAAGFVAADGQLDLGYVSRLTQEHLNYRFMGMSWFGNSQNLAVTQTLRLLSEIQAGPETTISMHGQAALTQFSSIDLAGSTDPQTAGLRPAGDQKFLSLGAGEAVGSQLNANWRVDQALDGMLFHPLGDTAGSSGNKSLILNASLNHTWAIDWAGIRTQLGAITSSAASSSTGTTSLSGEFAEMLVSWQRDWTPELKHSVAAGAFALRVDQWTLAPAGSASLLWRPRGFEVELRAAKSVSPNIYLGAAFASSLVGTRVALPLDQLETLRVLASADLEHYSMLGTATDSGSANVGSLRCALRWQPSELLVIGLEYTYRDQRAAEAASGTTRFFTFHRHLALLSIGLQYPPRGAAAPPDA